MQIRNITCALALSLALVLLLFMTLSSPPQAVRADSRELFATPDGFFGVCSRHDPCTLHSAMMQARDGDTVYVAQGIYTDTGEAVVLVTKSITLYGGWDGESTGSVVRDPETYVTILDGENARRVVHVTGSISPTIEGFTIIGGNAAHAPFNSGRGGGIHSLGATPRIARNIITNNVAGPSDADGRAYGGGIYLNNHDGTAVITANQIVSNVANAKGQGHGGGIFLSNAPAVQLVNNVVLSNTASITGGRGYGGGIALSASPDVLMTDNEIAYNVTYRGPDWRSCDGGGVYCSSSHDLTFRDNVVRGNVVNKNAAGGTGGGMQLWSCYRATIAHNRFEGNASSGQNSGSGGGLYTYAARDLILEANRFVDNHAYRGGGLYVGHNTGFTMTNNIVAENVGDREGGGMAFEAWSDEPVTGTLLHNTFGANDRGDGDGRIAIHVNEAYVTLVLTNNLIYSHTYGVYVVPTSTVRLNHTFFYAHTDGDTGGSGTIINTNPITGRDPLLTADYHLGSDSPAINAGADAGVSTDIDGDARPGGGGYDIGADEFFGTWVYVPLVMRWARKSRHLHMSLGVRWRPGSRSPTPRWTRTTTSITSSRTSRSITSARRPSTGRGGCPISSSLWVTATGR